MTSAARRARPSTEGAELRGFDPPLGLDDFVKCTSCVPCTCPQPPRAKRHHCLNTCENATCTTCRGLGAFCTRAPNVWVRVVDAMHIERSCDDGANWKRVCVSSRPSLFVNAAFKVSGSDAALAEEKGATATTSRKGSPQMRRRVERAISDAKLKVKIDALVSMLRSKIGVSDARSIDDVVRVRAELQPRRAVGVVERKGRPPSSDGELFYVTARIACVSVASLVRRVFAHLRDAPIEWRGGRKSKSKHANTLMLEAFVHREQRRLISQHEYRARLDDDDRLVVEHEAS